jgi:hypothetical protein
MAAVAKREFVATLPKSATIMLSCNSIIQSTALEKLFQRKHCPLICDFLYLCADVSGLW